MCKHLYRALWRAGQLPQLQQLLLPQQQWALVPQLPPVTAAVSAPPPGLLLHPVHGASGCAAAAASWLQPPLAFDAAGCPQLPPAAALSASMQQLLAQAGAGGGCGGPPQAVQPAAVTLGFPLQHIDPLQHASGLL